MLGVSRSATLYSKAMTEKLEQCAGSHRGCHQCLVLEQCLKLRKTISGISRNRPLRREEYVRLTYRLYELTSLARERSHPVEELKGAERGMSLADHMIAWLWGLWA